MELGHLAISVWNTAQTRGNKRDEKDLHLWRRSMPQRSRPSLLGTHRSFLRGYSFLLASVLKALSIWFPNLLEKKIRRRKRNCPSRQADSSQKSKLDACRQGGNQKLQNHQFHGQKSLREKF